MTRNFKFGKESVQHYDYYRWVESLYKENGLNKILVSEARKRGIQTFLHTGLFEHGVQPDIGIIAPYMFEDILRISNPNWIPLNRWNNRRAPGLLSFAFSGARNAIRERLVHYLNEIGYDGINFYTYNENTGIGFEDEFGFEEPIVEKFRKKFPNINLRSNQLTGEQRLYWYKIKGEFVTIFLKELHADLKKYKKSLSIVLNPDNPSMPQPAWGKGLRATGNIYLDWKNWIKEGVIDEIWIQSGPIAKQITLLNEILSAYKGKIKIVVRTNDPRAASWKKYTKMGVVLVAVVTSEKNGIEKYSRSDLQRNVLQDANWINRISVLENKTNGEKRIIDEPTLSKLLSDDNVLVRRKAIQAIGTWEYRRLVPNIERCLHDSELSVRLMAMATLASVAVSV